MHHRTNPIDADLCVLGFAIPQPPVQPAPPLRRSPAFARHPAAGSSADRPPACCWRCWSRMPMWNQSRIAVSLMSASARMRRSPEHPSVKAVSTVSSVRPTASRLRRIRTSSVRYRSWRRRAKTAAHPSPFRHCRPAPPMPLAILTAADERGIQGHRNGRAAISSLVTAQSMRSVARDLQGYACSQVSGSLPGINPKTPGFSTVSGHPVWHQGRKLRLKLVPFRRRPAMRDGQTNASLDRANIQYSENGEDAARDLAKMRRDGRGSGSPSGDKRHYKASALSAAEPSGFLAWIGDIVEPSGG